MQVHVTQSAKGLSCVEEERELWGSELGVSQSPPVQLPPRVTTARVLPVPGTQKKQSCILLSCCYTEAGLLIKSEPDLRGNWKETCTLVLADILELPSSRSN